MTRRRSRPILGPMRSNLVSWQWSGYAANHAERSNLVLHLVTVPVFIAGLAAALTSPLTGIGWLGAGIGAMVIALVAQGRGHRGESAAPVPFTGPGDFASRFLTEQLVSFPRFVVSGGWRRAWRNQPQITHGSTASRR
jgi:phage terminase small subunit